MNNKDSAASAKKTLSKADRHNLHLRVLICAVTCTVVTVLFLVAIIPARYSLSVGMVPPVTIAATKDVVDVVTTEKRRAEAADAVTPPYVYQEGATESVMAEFDLVFEQLISVSQYSTTLENVTLNRVFSKDEIAWARSILTLLYLPDYQMSTLLRVSPDDMNSLYEIVYQALENAMRAPVYPGSEEKTVDSIVKYIGFLVTQMPGGQTVLQNVVTPLLRHSVKANQVIDEEKYAKMRAEASESIENIIYKQGQNIVVRGEGRITQNQIVMLEELGLLSNKDADINPYLGGAVLSVMVISLMYCILARLDKNSFRNPTKLLLISIIFCLTFALAILLRLISVYLMPVLLCGMLAATLVTARAGLVVNASMAILVAGLSAGSSQAYTEQSVLIIMTAVISGSLVVLLLASNKSSRLIAVLAGLSAAASDFAIYISVSLMTQADLTNTLTAALWHSAGTLMATFLFLGLQPLLELIFNLPTTFKLMELSNPNRPLLKRLLMEAPGTYHHSIIVANLAEASAEAIGANPLLARVGGYYHDIGKLKRPFFFKENQSNGINPHDQTDPGTSAAIVTAHVRDGVAMAREARLPADIVTIISEHHGDTPVMYFYHKALQQANGTPVDINAFRYAGHPPTTRESAIVMLCDTIEAAVRTMKNPTASAIESFIVKLVRGKLEDGQLSDSDLTLKDIDKICAACTNVLVGVFHERIEYPHMESHDMRILSAVNGDPAPAQKAPASAAPAQKAPAPAASAPPAAPATAGPAAPASVQKAPEKEKESVSPLIVTPPSVKPVPVVRLETTQPLPVIDPEDLAVPAPYIISSADDPMPEDSVPEGKPGEDGEGGMN